MSDEVLKALRCLSIDIDSPNFKNLDFSEIKRAYKKMVFKFHPDRSGLTIGVKFVQEINQAYTLLKRMYFDYYYK